MGEHQAGMPVRLPPLRGDRGEAHACGPRLQEPRAPLQTTAGLTSLGAASAL